MSDNSSDELFDDEGGVQTALSLGSIEVDDHFLVAFERDRTAQYFVGRVLELTEEIRSICSCEKKAVINLEMRCSIILKTVILAFIH